MDKKIFDCEMNYYKCFSTTVELENVVRFRDDKLSDMYDYNFSYFTNKAPSMAEIEEELSYRRGEAGGFCNICAVIRPGFAELSSLSSVPEISTNGFYRFDASKLSLFKDCQDLSIKKVTDKAMLDDLLSCDLAHDEKTLGRDFCTRRCYRRGKVYLAEGGVDSYICYSGGVPVGNCDLFIHNGAAKIEDFAVNPKYQRRGFGTAILKCLIQIALDKGCELIYLVTDEDDTAKDMYKKLGFTKVGEQIGLLFKF